MARVNDISIVLSISSYIFLLEPFVIFSIHCKHTYIYIFRQEKMSKEKAGKKGEPKKRSLEFRGKAAFEQERDEILRQLPDAYKNMFGRIGFAKWSNMTLPVLILNPYDVPPRPVRAQWLGHFQNVRVFAEDRLLRIFTVCIRVLLYSHLSFSPSCHV